MADIILDKVKEDWADEQVESSFEDWSYVASVLKDHFMSQVEDKTEKEFIVYLRADLGYEKEEIDRIFKESILYWGDDETRAALKLAYEEE